MKRKINTLKRGTKGITLIALVITIIVLLILAGISIMMLTGENSILNRAGQASESSRESTEAEQVNLAVMAAVTDSSIKSQNGIQKDKLEEELGKYFNGATVSEDGDDYLYEGEYKTYRISKDGTIAEEQEDNSALSVKLDLTYNKDKTITKDGTIVGEVVENVPIPVGFKHVAGTEKATGLVIESNDEYKNQFVWVPVNQEQTLNLTITTDEKIQSIKLKRPDGTEEDITSGGKKQTISMKSGDVYRNGLYVVKVTTDKSSKIALKVVSTLYGQDTNHIVMEDFENQVTQIVNMIKDQATQTYTTTSELLQAKSKNSVEELLTDAEQDNMTMYMYVNKVYVEDQEDEIKWFVIQDSVRSSGTTYTDNSQQQQSVETYGGFYIARYEAGDGDVSEERTESTEEHAVVSKNGAYVYNFVTRSEAITLAASMYNTASVKSQLITGAGWDRTLNWLVETGMSEESVFRDSKDWGNYYDSTKDTDKAGSSNMNYTTGRSDNWKANNIYDLAGNVWEWTTETSSNSDLPCVDRGGDYYDNGSSNPASIRNSNDGDGSDHSVSFRPSLYLVNPNP